MSLSRLYKIIILLLAVSVFFGGCSGDRHLKDLAVAEGMAIDKYYDSVRLGVQVLNVGMSEQSQKPEGNKTVNFNAEGKTVADAVGQLGTQISKRIFFGQNKITVIGSELAREGAQSYMDFFTHSDYARPDVPVCIADGEADFILQSGENGANVPCENILYLVNNNQKSGQSIVVTVNDLLNLYNDKTSDIYMPVLKRDNKNTAVKTAGIALFANGKLARITNGEETAGFVIMQNKATEVSLNFTDDKYGLTSAELSNIRTRKRAEVSEGKIIFCVSVTADLTLNEFADNKNISLSKEDYARLEASAREKTEEICRKAFAACQSSGGDCLRIGEYLAKANAQLYNSVSDEWSKYYAAVRFDVNADVEIKKINDNSRLE